MGFIRSGVLAAMALILPGCTTMALNSLNGAGMCPPEAISNAYALRFLNAGDAAEQLSSLSPPEKISRIQFRDGRTAQLSVYRTGHPRCRMPSNEELTPVLTLSGRILAVGTPAVLPYIRQATSTTTVSEVSTGPSFMDVMMGRF